MSLGSFASRVVATKVVATDGTGDFTDIQSAINDLPSGGGVVYIKEGTYTITAKIEIKQDNTALIGSGRATQIKTTSGIHIIDDDSHTGLFISQLLLTGSGSAKAGQVGINFATTKDSAISNCWFKDIGTSGIIFSTSTTNNNVITENHIEDCIEFGIELSGTENVCSNNIIRNNQDGGIQLLADGDKSVITGNIITGNTDQGIRCLAADVLITNNFISTNVEDGITLQTADDVIISNNIIIDNDSGDTATFSGIRTIQTSTNVVITGNSMHGNDKYQIDIEADNSVIVGNRLDDTGAVGNINDTSTGSVVASNKET